MSIEKMRQECATWVQAYISAFSSGEHPCYRYVFCTYGAPSNAGLSAQGMTAKDAHASMGRAVSRTDLFAYSAIFDIASPQWMIPVSEYPPAGSASVR